MAWQIDCHEQEKYITVINVETCSAQDVIDQVEMLIKLTREKSIYNVLVDDTQMKMQLSVSDIQHLPQLYKMLGMPKHGRVALIFSETTHRAKDFVFYQKVAQSAGYSLELFQDQKTALGWLIGG
jgi:hypothetical protein